MIRRREYLEALKVVEAYEKQVPTFEVGDEIMVVDEQGHYYKVGDVVKIYEVTDSSLGSAIYSCRNKEGIGQVLYHEQVKKV